MPQPLDSIIKPLRAQDLAQVAALEARTFGPGRFARTAYRVREGGHDLSSASRVAWLGEALIASVRMTEITIGGLPGALLLGPLVVAAEQAGRGLGRRLVEAALDAAREAGATLVLLVGDLSYYGPHGFAPVSPGRIALPGPVDPARLLVAELAPGAAERYSGLVQARRTRGFDRAISAA